MKRPEKEIRNMLSELDNVERPPKSIFMRVADLAAQQLPDDQVGSIIYHFNGQEFRIKRKPGESMDELLDRLRIGFPPTHIYEDEGIYHYEVEPTGKTKDDLRSTDYEAKPVSKDDRTADWESDPKFKK